MKKIIITYLVLALMGCSASNDESDYGTENTGTAIRFATGMAPTITTRGQIISDENGLITEAIPGVQILREDGVAPFFTNGITPAVTQATIKAEYVDNNNLMSLNQNQYFKLDHSDVGFMAYYPAGTFSAASGPTPAAVNYTITGAEDIITSNLDVADFDTKREVSFSFDHQLTHIKLKVKAENDGEAAAFGNLTEASINVQTNLKLSIVDSESNPVFDPMFKLEKASPANMKDLSFLSGGNAVELKGGTQDIGELMIYPEQFNDITLAFTHKSKQTYSLNWTASTDLLKAGKTNTITINLKAYEISFSVSVTPWGKGNGDGEEISIGGEDTGTGG